MADDLKFPQLCGVANPGAMPCSKTKGHDGAHDDAAYGRKGYTRDCKFCDFKVTQPDDSVGRQIADNFWEDHQRSHERLAAARKGRQRIGVYVNTDADRRRLLEALKSMRSGFLPNDLPIPSLDWDEFEEVHNG